MKVADGLRIGDLDHVEGVERVDQLRGVLGVGVLDQDVEVQVQVGELVAASRLAVLLLPVEVVLGPGEEDRTDKGPFSPGSLLLLPRPSPRPSVTTQRTMGRRRCPARFPGPRRG